MPKTSAAWNGEVALLSPMDGEEDVLAVFRADGSSGTIGGRGEGPGEFYGIRAVRYSQGRFHVFSRGRETLYDDDLALEGTRVLPVSMVGGVALAPDGSSVIQGWAFSPERGVPGGPVFHSVSNEGARSFGPALDLETARAGNSRKAYVLGEGDLGVWSVRRDGFVFQQWSTTGELMRTVRGTSSVDFGNVPATERINPFQAPPPPTVMAVREEGGLLWVATLVPRRDWEPIDVPPGEGPEAYLARATESLIEVIDIRSGRLVAAKRIPRMIDDFLGSGTAKSWRVDDIGAVWVELLEVRLQQEGGR